MKKTYELPVSKYIEIEIDFDKLEEEIKKCIEYEDLDDIAEAFSDDPLVWLLRIGIDMDELGIVEDTIYDYGITDDFYNYLSTKRYAKPKESKELKDYYEEYINRIMNFEEFSKLAEYFYDLGKNSK